MKSKKSIKLAALLLTTAILSADIYGTSSLVYARQSDAQSMEEPADINGLENKNTAEEPQNNEEEIEDTGENAQENEGNSGEKGNTQEGIDAQEGINGQKEENVQEEGDSVGAREGSGTEGKTEESAQSEIRNVESVRGSGSYIDFTEELQDAMEISPAEAFAELLKDYDMYGLLTNGEEFLIRQEPAETAAVVQTLTSGYQVKLTGAVLTENGVWFQVAFAVNDVEYSGYIQSDHVISQDERLSEWKAQYLNNIMYKSASQSSASGRTDLSSFPKSYRSYIQKLIQAHPNWTFVPMNTGLKWSEVVENEMVNGRNLVDINHPVTWKSLASEDYNMSTGEWVIKNGTTWVQASESIVKYYLDPRNFLNESSVFQFEQLTYNGTYHTEAGVEKILKGTFMSNKKLEDGSGGGITYAQAFMKIGKELKVSPYFLASRVRQEQGVNGTSSLISGTYPGYKGYYNYFNIGATGIGTDVITSGLTTAKNNGWNTRYKALYGGANVVSANYITKGQDTFYLQKFDVDGSYNGLYWHQYMQNLLAADNEGINVQSSYKSMGVLNNSFVFKVPVYKSMPSSRCPKPGDKLSKPVLTAEKNGNTSVKLSWKEIGGAQGYQIYRSENNGAYTKIKTVTGLTKTSYEDKTVVPGKTYTYKVRAYLKLKGGNQYSSYSEVKTIDYSVPKASWKTFQVKNYKSIELGWKKASATGYKIYRKTDSGKYVCINTIKKNTTLTYTDNTVLPGHTYSYRIRAYSTIDGKNYYSAYTKVKTATIKMTKPTLTKATVSGGSKIKLTWKRDKKASGYYIYRAASEKGKYEKVKTISSNKTLNWSDSNITTGITYYYKIRSYVKSTSGTATSSYSKILSVNTKLVKPTVTSVTASSGKVHIEWKKNSKAGGYRIYRAASSNGTYKLVKKITKNTTVNWTDKNVTAGKNYYYRIRAYAVTGGKTKYSAYSGSVNVQVEK